MITWKSCLYKLSIFAACALLNGQSAAQQAMPVPAQAEPVVVTGQASSIRKALLAQDASNPITSVVSADDIGTLPDRNAAEALARMPGVSVQRDQGEGRYAVIRGLGPDLNTVTINGALVPAPENGRRGVSLDVLPAGMIRSLEVIKTLTPDMDANSLGGTIEIKTLSAFDLPGKFLSANAGLGYDQLSKKSSPSGSLLWSDRFAEGKLGVALGISAEKYTRDIVSQVLGGSKAWDDWKLEGRIGLSSANEDQPDALNSVAFRQNVTGLTFKGTVLPVITAPAGSTLYDPSKYALNAITFQSRLSEDKEKHGKFDLSRRLNLGNFESTLKVGFKSSRREKTNNTDQWTYNSATATSPNYWGAGPTTLNAFNGSNMVDFPQMIGLSIDPALVRARAAGLNKAGALIASTSAVSDWRMNEDINAYYAQASTDVGNWNVLAGVRQENTNFEARGNQFLNNAITPTFTTQSFGNTLPNLQIRNNIDKNTSLRAAYTHSVVRANFSQLAPGIAYSSPTEATIGNPNLKPLTSANLDAGIERLLGNDGVMSLYLFTKDIKDFTYTTNLAGTGQWSGFSSAILAVNGDKAKVKGLELAYTQVLRQLPGALSGLIVGANATLTDSKTVLSRFDKANNRFLSRELALPGQSDRVVNLVLGYESGPLSARVASNYKSRYLLQTGNDIVDSKLDAWVDGQRQIDLSIKYQISKSIRLS
ncbi:MAG: TonB-dependent receptor, partial [Betaproteobacteria bacterium]|nr:TonB-dependent receptor [Betaproteobacteria bacterium]